MAGTTSAERPAKRAKLLSDAEDSSDSDAENVTGVVLPESLVNRDGKEDGKFKVNEEYARRFEHNKKREELQRLEEKYKRDSNAGEDDSDESTSEEEDDEGEFATEELDKEIFDTLKALRSKDPRIYDKDSTFFKPFNAEDVANAQGKKEKSMTLQDYQRQNLLAGNNEDAQQDAPQTFDQEQEALRRNMVSQMHAVEDDEDSDKEGFLVQKSRHVPEPHTQRRKKVNFDVEGADQDPETYLSNFMAARAWVPDETSRFAHLDSDDSDDEQRADEFEQAYNMRFENPETANEKLMTYGRDVGKHSVRREEVNPRKRQREREREEKDRAKQERRDEKARLRRLKIDEVERKLQQVKEAAGLGAADVVDVDDWRDMIDGDWDDAEWETEMAKRFGDKYYAGKDDDLDGVDAGEDETEAKSGKKPKKPKWDDDIDIKDLVPDFEDEDPSKPAFTLTDDEAESEANDGDDGEPSGAVAAVPEKRKSRKETAADRKRAARQQRQKIEELVDSRMDLDLPNQPGSKQEDGVDRGLFRYRDTSPTSFGLTARDILFANDADLNQYAGMKKHHAFRDADKKKKDAKKLGKKARLRQWRKDTFGDESGYAGDFASYVRKQSGMPDEVEERPKKSKNVETPGGDEKKRNRRRKKKAGQSSAA